MTFDLAFYDKHSKSEINYDNILTYIVVVVRYDTESIIIKQNNNIIPI